MLISFGIGRWVLTMVGEGTEITDQMISRPRKWKNRMEQLRFGRSSTRTAARASRTLVMGPFRRTGTRLRTRLRLIGTVPQLKSEDLEGQPRSITGMVQ